MGSIQDKIDYLNDTKNAIRSALETRGVEVNDTDTFRSYADKIETLSTSAPILEKSFLQVRGSYDQDMTFGGWYEEPWQIEWGSEKLLRGDAFSYDANTGKLYINKDCYIRMNGTINLNGNNCNYQLRILHHKSATETTAYIFDSSVIDGICNFSIPERIFQCEEGDWFTFTLYRDSEGTSLMRLSRSFVKVEEL